MLSRLVDECRVPQARQSTIMTVVSFRRHVSHAHMGILATSAVCEAFPWASRKQQQQQQQEACGVLEGRLPGAHSLAEADTPFKAVHLVKKLSGQVLRSSALA